MPQVPPCKRFRPSTKKKCSYNQSIQLKFYRISEYFHCLSVATKQLQSPHAQHLCHQSKKKIASFLVETLCQLVNESLVQRIYTVLQRMRTANQLISSGRALLESVLPGHQRTLRSVQNFHEHGQRKRQGSLHQQQQYPGLMTVPIKKIEGAHIRIDSLSNRSLILS